MARPRKPTKSKALANTLQPCRTNRAEPHLPITRPLPPAHLSETARTAWAGFAPILERMQVLTEADAAALERLCEVYAETLTLQEIIKTEGRLYETTTRDGSKMIRSHPAVAMLADADRRLAMYLQKFGLSPADRSRVSASGPDAPESGWDGI